MDWHLVQKILVGLAVITTIWLIFRPQKRKQHADPTIAEADERERYVWRYARWAARTIQFIFFVWMLSMVMSFILT
ncbi:hypothetical protein EFZ10_15825 [Tatumella sp. TA1]|nr:hypothetical protein EFZ10_15825 [Tatumella sp. TA1]